MLHYPHPQFFPAHDTYYHLLRAFQNGKPLSTEQLNFLYWHQHRLSSRNLDPLFPYYLINKKPTPFLLPQARLDRVAIARLQAQLKAALDTTHPSVQIAFTPEQYEQFKTLTPELIYYHGNPTLTGAPLFPGGISRVDHFQWGNLHGVVKYELLEGENEIEGNILVYFEDMQERLLEECVQESIHQYQLQHIITPPQPIPLIPQATPPIAPTPHPTLTLRMEPRFRGW